MKNMAVIAARANSKRLPNKNTMLLNNKPVISYSIEQCLKSNMFDSIFVASNEPKVLDISKNYDVSSFELEDHMCDSTTSATLVCIHLYNKIQKAFDTLTLIQPTSPLKTGEDIIKSFNVLKKEDRDFVVSVCDLEAHYFNFAIKKGIKGYELFFDKKYIKDSSLLEKVYRPNGAIKIAKVKPLLETGHFFGENLGISLMPEERSIHIATKFDFEVCEMFSKKNENLYHYPIQNNLN